MWQGVEEISEQGGMMIPHWYIERPDLSAEVRSFMCNSSLTVYENQPYGCFHIFRGNEEITSVRAPWGDAAREELRHRAYIAQNGLAKSEEQYVKDDHEKLERDGDQYQRDAVDHMVRNVMNYTADKKLYFTT